MNSVLYNKRKKKGRRNTGSLSRDWFSTALCGTGASPCPMNSVIGVMQRLQLVGAQNRKPVTVGEAAEARQGRIGIQATAELFRFFPMMLDAQGQDSLV